MSHEIRTPVNGITGMLQLLQITDLGNEQREYVQAALDASRRLVNLLSDILDLSRIDSGHFHISNSELELKHTLSQVEELFRPIARQTGIQLSCTVHPDIPDRVIGDATRIQQVLNNLLGNAFKFTPSGRVALEAFPLPAPKPGCCKVLFSVTDTGIGIQDKELDHLLKPFTQGSNGFNKAHQGAGLGLSICKNLITLMDGSMAVESTQGEGTTVYFHLVFDLPEQKRAAETTVAPDLPENSGEHIGDIRILLAEDERISSLAASRLLRNDGAVVSSVQDGKQVLEALQQDSFDLVLMDVQMPVLDGVEATKAIRRGLAGEHARNIPIIALTAYAMPGDGNTFLAAGMNGYLPKPIDLRALRSTIHDTLASSGRKS